MPSLLKALLWVAVASLSAACSDDTTVLPGIDTDTPAADDACKLYITLRFQEPQTRAADNNVWDGAYASDAGTRLDNYIDPESIRLTIYNNVGGNYQLLGTVKPDVIPGPTISDYMFVAQMADLLDLDLKNLTEENPVTFRLKVVMTANTTPAASIGDTRYNISSLDTDLTLTDLTDATGIPMMGVSEAEISFPNRLVADNAIDIYMLRAVAKAEINLSDGLYDDGFRFVSATISQAFNTAGMVMPLKWSDVTDTRKLTHIGDTFNPLASAVTTGVRRMTAINDKQLVGYLPETTCTNPRRPLSITLNYMTPNGIQRSTTLYMADYNANGTVISNTGHDVVRNHLYYFNISGGTDTYRVSYSVCPWTERTSGDINFN